LIMLKTYDQQFTLTTKKLLSITFKKLLTHSLKNPAVLNMSPLFP